MRTRNVFFRLALLLAGMTGMAFAALQGQVIMKAGSGTIEHNTVNGSILHLEIKGCHGNLQWQESTDGTAWTDCNGKTDSTCQFTAANNLYIRLSIKEGTCNEVFSDVVHVTTFNLPTVTAGNITEVSLNGAKSGGNVTDEGSYPVTTRGVCWSSKQEPSLDNAEGFTRDGKGTGPFASFLTGLSASTHYFVRAYATNSGGTGYSQIKEFNTVNETGNFRDPRDQHNYKWVKIGTQTWMSENLAWLPAVSPYSSFSSTVKHYYVNGYQGTDTAAAKKVDNYSLYGVFYNWPASLEACPPGWHLPSLAELSELTFYLNKNGYGYGGSGGDIAKALASRTTWGTSTQVGSPGWQPESNNQSGFNALAAGTQVPAGSVWGVGFYSSFYTSTGKDTASAYCIYLLGNVSNPSTSGEDKMYGLSVRCVKD